MRKAKQDQKASVEALRDIYMDVYYSSGSHYIATLEIIEIVEAEIKENKS